MITEKDFFNWMVKTKGLGEGTAKSNVTRMLRIDMVYDVHSAYTNDGGIYLLSLFDYSRQDAEDGLQPEHAVVIKGDYYTGTQSLKYALRLYFEYLRDTGFSPSALSTGIAAEAPRGKNLNDITDDEFNELINNVYTAMERLQNDCGDVSENEPDSSKPPVFMGDFKAFLRFVGPFCKNYVNAIAKKERSKHKGICEYCGGKAELQSAHRDGEERPVIIKAILEKHFKKAADYYEVDLLVFEKLFKNAHLPVEDHIFFLCDNCHSVYDKGTGITTADILARRHSN